MNPTIKNIFALIVGMAGGMAAISLAFMITMNIWPMPEGLDSNNVDQLCVHINTMPLMAFIAVIIGHAAGPFVGGLLAGLIAHHKKIIVLIIGILFTLFGISNLIMLPCHPWWMWIFDTLAYIPAAFLGAKLVMKKA